MPTCIKVSEYDPLLHSIIGGPRAGGCDGCNDLVPGNWKSTKYVARSDLTDQGPKYTLMGYLVEWSRPSVGRPVSYYELTTYHNGVRLRPDVGEPRQIPGNLNFHFYRTAGGALGGGSSSTAYAPVFPEVTFTVRAQFSDTYAWGPSTWQIAAADGTGLGPQGKSVSLSPAGTDAFGSPLKDISLSWSPPAASLPGFNFSGYRVELWRRGSNSWGYTGTTYNLPVGQTYHLIPAASGISGSGWYVNISARYLNGVVAH